MNDINGLRRDRQPDQDQDFESVCPVLATTDLQKVYVRELQEQNIVQINTDKNGNQLSELVYHLHHCNLKTHFAK